MHLIPLIASALFSQQIQIQIKKKKSPMLDYFFQLPNWKKPSETHLNRNWIHTKNFLAAC